MNELIDPARYNGWFAGESAPKDSRRAEALHYAHDIRKFEIELYWKRAAYFWTFIAVAFGGYLAMARERTYGDYDLVLTVAALGFVFSLAWYFVNRGSKAWQHNWETHVDLLEDAVTGPLHKTVLNRRTNGFWRLHQGYPFSPSNINHVLNMYVTAVWLVLLLETIREGITRRHLPAPTPIAIVTATVTAVVLLVTLGRTRATGASHTAHGSQRSYAFEGAAAPVEQPKNGRTAVDSTVD